VEDGVAFCPGCKAPQIRVSRASAAAETLPAAAVGTPAPLVASRTHSPARGVHWPQAFTSVALAALVTALFMTVPLGAFGLAMFTCGALSVALYRRRYRAAALTVGTGARLGALAGLLGFAVLIILFSAQLVLFHSSGQFRQVLLQAVEQAAAGSPDARAQQALQFLNTPQGFAAIMVVVLAFILAMFVLIASAGGAIGATLLREPASRTPGLDDEARPEATEGDPGKEDSRSA
jgi:hypothetical protein